MAVHIRNNSFIACDFVADLAFVDDPLLCYCFETDTIYRYESSSTITVNNLDVLAHSQGGNTRWIGIGGKYQYQVYITQTNYAELGDTIGNHLAGGFNTFTSLPFDTALFTNNEIFTVQPTGLQPLVSGRFRVYYAGYFTGDSNKTTTLDYRIVLRNPVDNNIKVVPFSQSSSYHITDSNSNNHAVGTKDITFEVTATDVSENRILELQTAKTANTTNNPASIPQQSILRVTRVNIE